MKIYFKNIWKLLIDSIYNYLCTILLLYYFIFLNVKIIRNMIPNFNLASEFFSYILQWLQKYVRIYYIHVFLYFVSYWFLCLTFGKKKKNEYIHGYQSLVTFIKNHLIFLEIIWLHNSYYLCYFFNLIIRFFLRKINKYIAAFNIYVSLTMFYRHLFYLKPKILM